MIGSLILPYARQSCSKPTLPNLLNYSWTRKVGQPVFDNLVLHDSTLLACLFVQATMVLNRTVPSSLHPSQWERWARASSKLNGTTLPSSPHSWSKPTPTSPRIQLTAVSRLCPLLPFSRFSSLGRSLLPPFFSHAQKRTSEEVTSSWGLESIEWNVF